jgi:Lon-like ATP-dependent protease
VSGSDGASEAAAEGASSSASSSEGAVGRASSEAGSASTAGSGSGSSAPALFALPLYRKPAFPGFYQIVQVSEQEVLDFLHSLRKNGQGEYLGGFMTKELPTKLDDSTIEPATTGNAAAASRNIRRDAGRITNVNELEEVGTVLQLINLTQYPNIAGGQIVVMPHRRIRRTRVVSAPSPHVALPAVLVEYLDEPELKQGDEDIKKMHQEIVATMKELLKTSFLYNEQFEQVIRFYDVDHPLKLADLVSGMSMAQRQELQTILEEENIHNRLKMVLNIVKGDLELARLQSNVKSEVEEKVTKEQRRTMLMEQMKQIMKELGIEKDEKERLVTQFRDAIKDKTIPEEPSNVIEAELTKLGTLEPSSSEFNVCRTYLEWLTCMPWGQYTTESKDIGHAEGILNEDHYGLEDVKERILEHIAVSFLKKTTQGKIMLLVGPPGTGKTSVGKSIARALDRKFYRFSVGGMHDVAEIRGHRRTYVGAMPGKLIQCLKLTQSSNPVVLIDEIDKLGRDYRGDPSSALLEVLDPEQNSSFRDHYLDVPIDLSRVMFVCTANVLDTIPGPLLDRMEVIRISGYVFEEKLAIAKQYLIPQITDSSGIGADHLDMNEEALRKIIKDYAREAGVRQLASLLAKVSRKVALSVVRKTEEERTCTVVDVDSLSKYIGQPIHNSDRLYASGPPPGVVMGLAWTAMGGASLFVEALGQLPRNTSSRGASSADSSGTCQVEIISSKDEKEDEGGGSAKSNSTGGGDYSSVKVTGQLGEVMSESSAISHTYARLFLRELDNKNNYLDQAKVHINVPEGATPKDGPSAGVTMATALVSLSLNKPVKNDLAMTGELTLTGKVLKVGGIKEKVIAARREKVDTLLLPRQNEPEFVELKEYLRAGITAHFVDHYDDVYRFAFPEGEVPALPVAPRGMPVVTIQSPDEEQAMASLPEAIIRPSSNTEAPSPA